MRTVWKYTIPVDDGYHPIPVGKVVHVEWLHHDAVYVWVETDVEESKHRPAVVQGLRGVRVFGTGQPIPDDIVHLGTAVMPDDIGRLVWHLYGGPDA